MRTRRATDRNQSHVASVLSDDYTKQFAAIRISESRRHFAIRHSPNSRRTRPIADPHASAWKQRPGEVRESAQPPEIACELRVTDLARDSAGRARAQSTTTAPADAPENRSRPVQRARRAAPRRRVLVDLDRSRRTAAREARQPSASTASVPSPGPLQPARALSG
jgi:hypothetical protein